ncbi:MAG: hypothetical protein GY708_00835 [Actinomycetia bacterium]|nr:hypothetical protein [Actinomycetes bacterium]
MKWWFAIVLFAYYYKALLCGLAAHTLGLVVVCEPLIWGISVNHWIEIIVYCPLMWLALRQVNVGVFGDTSLATTDSRPTTRGDVRRHKLIGEAAIAIYLYGTGIHITNVIEIYSREEEGVTSGDVYDLIYFLDEGLSHYLQFIPLFFVLGWFVMHDRPGRTGSPTLALLFGVGHGVERAIGIIEGGKWFLGPPTVVWLTMCVVLRMCRRGPEARDEFFVRYAITFCVTLPLAQVAYWLRFGSFDQPSNLGASALAEMAVGGIILTATGGLVVLAIQRVRIRRARVAPKEA